MPRKKSSGPVFSSRRENLSGRDKLREAIRRQEVGEQTKALFSSESGKAILLGEIVLDALLSLPGRTLLATGCLLAAWFLL